VGIVFTISGVIWAVFCGIIFTGLGSFSGMIGMCWQRITDGRNEEGKETERDIWSVIEGMRVKL
jgi:hypothetical protein